MKYTNKEEEYIGFADETISELVYEKDKLIKAYRYYHGKRDPEQFRHLEENYGIGNATSVEFVPLARKHIDVLIGEYLTIPVQPKISCKDSATITNIFRDKQLEINSRISKQLSEHLQNVAYKSVDKTDIQIIRELEDLKESLGRTFISEYEIAAQNIIDWSMQSRNIDFVNKRRLLLTDLAITGTCYFRTLESVSKTNVDLKILNSLDTFLDRNYNSRYNKNSARAVVREYLTKDEILLQWGEYLNEESLDVLDSLDYKNERYARGYDLMPVIDEETDGILGNFEVTPNSLNYNRHSFYKRLPVYDVEWLKTEKENGKYIMNRYRVIRIGTDIYIPLGKVENVTRSSDNPEECSLSVNGVFLSDRNGEPISLMLETANLQD